MLQGVAIIWLFLSGSIADLSFCATASIPLVLVAFVWAIWGWIQSGGRCGASVDWTQAFVDTAGVCGCRSGYIFQTAWTLGDIIWHFGSIEVPMVINQFGWGHPLGVGHLGSNWVVTMVCWWWFDCQWCAGIVIRSSSILQWSMDKAMYPLELGWKIWSVVGRYWSPGWIVLHLLCMPRGVWAVGGFVIPLAQSWDVKNWSHLVLWGCIPLLSAWFVSNPFLPIKQ